jgi:pSer/pThr/pTyr-binding forkhead associated (FHA) protein
VPESLLNVLKICLLLLLYLFFFRVLRAVWAEVTGPKVVEAAPARAGGRQRRRGRGAQDRLVVVEPPEHRGRAYELADELTVGRAAGCQITLDDSFVSQLHARVFRRDGQLYVEDLGSTNGTYLNTKKVAGPTIVRRGDALQIGRTVMELT